MCDSAQEGGSRQASFLHRAAPWLVSAPPLQPTPEMPDAGVYRFEVFLDQAISRGWEKQVWAAVWLDWKERSD